jgi:hypothetical protein
MTRHVWPYMRIGILGVCILGLLDFGETRTMLSTAGWKRLADKNLPLETTTLNISVAIGSVVKAVWCTTMPITVQDKVKLLYPKS